MKHKQKRSLAFTTLIGLAGGVFCVVIAIFESGNLKLFYNLPSLLIIVGGTAFSLIMAYPFSTIKTLPKVIAQAFIEDKFDLLADIETILELSERARKDGLLSLESYAEETQDHFLKKSLNLLVDGPSREDLENSMMSEIHHAAKRQQMGASMVSMIATVAPGLGLVGTYVGLIPMLVEMNDPDALGPMMAIELVSSFYGGFMANVIFSPMAKKLQMKSAKEKQRNELILEGILAIHEGKNPRAIREDLMAYLTKHEGAKVSSVKRKAGTEDSNSKVIDYRKSKTKQRGA